MRLNAVMVSVQEDKPGYRFGQLARTPLRSGEAEALVRVPLPVDIPENAIVSKAELVLTAGSTEASSRTYSARRIDPDDRFGVNTPWNKKPAATGTTLSVSVPSAVARKTTFRIDVTDHVQLWVAGTEVNRGWLVTTTSSAAGIKVQGSPANVGEPWLDLEYVLPGDPPWDLEPAGGTIDIAQPTLTFSTGPDTAAVRAQVATDDEFTDIVFDSGQVDISTGVVPLAGSGYSIPDATTVYWRAAALDLDGWTDWSEIVEVSRQTFTDHEITSPTGVAGDTTPPLVWDYAGTQTAWRVQLWDDTRGVLLDDSRRTAGNDDEWTPETGLRGVGSVGRIVSRVWDDVADRIPCAGGGLDYSERVETFTVVAAGSAPAPSFLTAVQQPGRPFIRLTWGYDTQPDKWQIERDGQWLTRIEGDRTTFVDRSATMLHEHTYRIRAVVSGEVSNLRATDTVTGETIGIWLVDTEDEASHVAILDVDQGTQTMEEQAATHAVIGAPPVRRRLGLVPPAGAQAGRVATALGINATDAFATLMDWKTQDPSHVYRLVLGDWNIPVNISDITIVPTPDGTTGDPVYAASFNWQQIDAELPW